MSAPETRFENALRSLGELPAPPLSPELDALVRSSSPVRRRRPWRTFVLLLLASFAVLAIHVHSHDVRHDFAAIPKRWFWTMAGAWLVAFLVPLSVALVPRRGSMFADTRAARALAFAIPTLAIVMAVFLRIDAPPATIIPQTTAETVEYIEWCLVTGFEMAVLPFALGVLVLRRAPLPLHTRWIGGALGAANGTFVGLMLHVHCWIGGPLHAGVAHGGQAVLGAIVGALVVPLLAERRSPAA